MDKYIKVNKRRFSKTRHQPRTTLPLKGKQFILTVVTLILLLLFILTNHSTVDSKRLRDQPTYSNHNRTCTATLCNPLNRCSTWSANKVYDWSTLSQVGLFRDLATAQVTVGCELRIKVEDRVRGGEWLSLSDGFTECSESGYGRKCRNLVEVDLKANALILAKQLKHIMTEEQNGHSKDIVLTQQGIVRDTMGVTLVSQFPIDQLETFTKVIEEWEGPISIAMYFTHFSDIDLLIEHLQDPNHLTLYSRVTLSLVKPDFQSSNPSNYPINHLRNIAIAESSTEYVFVVDADFMPSKYLHNLIHSKLIPTITHSPKNTAWIVPSFYMRKDYKDLLLPATFKELKNMVAKQIAYTPSTCPTRTASFSMGKSLAYEVCYELHWEPYYIVHRSAPFYDVRFQGEDRQSHALQLNAERYRFMVLSETFIIRRDDHERLPRKKFDESHYFKDYINEIELLYGKWARWPRGCSAGAIGWQDQGRNTLGLATGAT